MTFNLKRIHKAVNWNKEDDGFTQAFWEQNVKQFWLPEEISVSKDLKCWSMLSEKEKELYKKVLAGLTLLDTKQGNNGVPSMMNLTENLQIDELFNWIENEPTLQRKADLILAQYENTNDNESLYLSMVTSVFLESFLFYSGFFYPLYLAGQGKMVASGEIISLILRDESLHGKYIGLLAQELFNSFDEYKKSELKNKAYSIFESLMENEINYTKTIYDGTGFTNEVINFLKYNANRALENLGFESYYEVSDINPIVLNGLSTETKSHDFFSTKGNGYQKGIYEELEDEDFIV